MDTANPSAAIEFLTWLFIGGFALLCLLIVVFAIGADPVETEHRRQKEHLR